MEDLAHASCHVPAVLKVLRDRGEVPRGVPPVWWRARGERGVSPEPVANGFKRAAVTAVRVKYTVWVDGCRLVKIDAREGAQVAMVT